VRQDAFVAEIELEPFCNGYEAARAALRYKPLPRYPAVERDFSLFVPDGTLFSTISDAIRALGISEVAAIDAVDLFRGKNVPAGKFSLLVRVTFQSYEGTLTEGLVSDFSSRILAVLEQNLGASLRA
jgi:phenylalanyl-tRNA synthetase beta chain